MMNLGDGLGAQPAPPARGSAALRADPLDGGDGPREDVVAARNSRLRSTTTMSWPAPPRTPPMGRDADRGTTSTRRRRHVEAAAGRDAPAPHLTIARLRRRASSPPPRASGNARRWALLRPMPGRRASSSMSRWIGGSNISRAAAKVVEPQPARAAGPPGPGRSRPPRLPGSGAELVHRRHHSRSPAISGSAGSSTAGSKRTDSSSPEPRITRSPPAPAVPVKVRSARAGGAALRVAPASRQHGAPGTRNDGIPPPGRIPPGSPRGPAMGFLRHRGAGYQRCAAGPARPRKTAALIRATSSSAWASSAWARR